MYEHKKQPLLSRRKFARRMLRSIGTFTLLVVGSLAVGTIGYHSLGLLGWVDALLNASMILTGMGPVSTLPSNAAKIFASSYALFSGVMFLVAVGVVLAPLIHRFQHRFNLETDEE